ncbi:MAG TPA: TSUP family transporter [Verrucomicrobiae bacterium]|nr:TSUP family transporter [Verrucomicrobiae bacterium]
MNLVSYSAIPAWGFAVLFLTGLVAGFVDSIAGGGGLITLPVLLSLGLPPQFALGTNKLQATFGSATAAWHYTRAGLVDLHKCKWGIVFTIVGATAGTVTVQHLDATFLKHFIPVVLIAIAAYMFFKPQLGAEDIHPRMKTGIFYLVVGLGLGFYDGFIGPGTGTFWTMALMLGLGFNLTKATAHTKVMNFASNITSLTFFACAGQMYVAAGLAMGAGQLLGARAGSSLVVTKGTKFIRPIFLATVLVVTVKLLFDSYRK